jgi:putative solute:sodium symporter small subunit
MDKQKMKAYWRTNLRYLLGLMAVWFVVSYGCGILFAEELNKIRMGGFKLGFWFAQQGSIYVFVVLIFIYVRLMNKLDHKFDVYEEDEELMPEAPAIEEKEKTTVNT